MPPGMIALLGTWLIEVGPVLTAATTEIQNLNVSHVDLQELVGLKIEATLRLKKHEPKSQDVIWCMTWRDQHVKFLGHVKSLIFCKHNMKVS